MTQSGTASDRPSTTTHRPHVLIVDDDELLRKQLSAQLQAAGCDNATAEDGATALRILQDTDFDVVLLDLEMPHLNGFQLLDALRNTYPDVVPVVLAGDGDTPRVVRAIRLGAHDFLEKPCDTRLLRRAIERAAEYRRLRHQAEEMQAQIGETRSQLEREREVNQAQKLEAVGRLAAGIAHEINTPTQYVGDNIEFLQSAYESMAPLLGLIPQILKAAAEGPVHAALLRKTNEALEDAHLDYVLAQAPRAISQAIEGIDRITSIVQAMKEFSHPGADEKTFTDLNHCLRSTITVSRNEWKYVAKMETDFDPALPPVCCLPGELNQVFLNLIVNAAHAIGDTVGGNTEAKGIIRVRTKRDGDSVKIQFSDTGPGIPEEIRNRVFEPFFTTKEVGRGTGQGLAVARHVVEEKHAGSITFSTEMGAGTTFTIQLPVHA